MAACHKVTTQKTNAQNMWWNILKQNKVILHMQKCDDCKCWMTKDLLVMKQFSLLETISTATVLLAMVVESRVFHVVG